MILNNQQLKGCMKGITPQNIEKYLPWMVQILPKYGVDTPLRLSHYLSQIGHEAQNFSAYRENLNYSEEGLLKTFKSDFDINKDKVLSPAEKAKAKKLARKPKEIADFVYANQNGNGNEATGDGSKYIGRGAIMVTGESNYLECSKFIFGDDRLLKNPELLELPQYSIMASMWFWTKHKLNSLADKDDVKAITKIINGGYNGLDDRIARLNNCKRYF